MRRLLIFFKHPTPGCVKTRLAAAIGDEAAAEVHRACVELTLERLSAFQAQAVVCVDPPEALEVTRQWIASIPLRRVLGWARGSHWLVRPQIGSTLGERLSHATAEAFTEGAARVVVIGTDSPWLGADDIGWAFAALADHDLVLGPTEDGGYYLIGLSRPLPALFEGISWGTSSVYETTLARARAAGLRFTTLPIGYDIDRVDDLQRFLKHHRSTRYFSRFEKYLVPEGRQPCPS